MKECAMTQKSRRKAALSLVVLVMLAACGGGGGGGATGPGGGGGSGGGGEQPAAKTWQTEQLIEINNAGGASGAQIALDGNGNATAVWLQFDGTRNNIWANRFTLGAGWGTAQLIETDSGNASAPQIAAAANGDVIAIWSQSDGTRDSVWANRFTLANNGWSVAQLVESNTSSESVYNPQIAIDAVGNAVAVWAQGIPGAGQNLWANRFTPAGGWGVEERITAEAAARQQKLRIAANPGGDTVVIWLRNQFVPESRNDIMVSRFSPTGGWSGPISISGNDQGLQDDARPDIAIDPAGNVVAVWGRYSASDRGLISGIQTNRFTPANGWGTPAFLNNDRSVSARFPRVATDASGNAIAVWEQNPPDSIYEQVWAARFTPMDGWGTETNIPAVDYQRQRYERDPRIAMNANGDAVIMKRNFATGTTLEVNRYTPTGGWTAAERIHTGNEVYDEEPQIAIDTNGNAIAIWEKTDGQRGNIWANRYQ
jgi:hypothetical protein